MDGQETHAERVPVARSNTSADMRKFENYKHVGYRICTSTVLHSVWVVIQDIVSPVEHERNLTSLAHKTIRGSAGWLRSVVSGEHREYVPKLVSACFGDFILTQAGLLGCNEHGALRSPCWTPPRHGRSAKRLGRFV